jgi:rubredoxin
VKERRVVENVDLLKGMREPCILVFSEIPRLKCRCGTQMVAEKYKIDDTYRYRWVCPKCGLKQDFEVLKQKKGTKRG